MGPLTPEGPVFEIPFAEGTLVQTLRIQYHVLDHCAIPSFPDPKIPDLENAIRKIFRIQLQIINVTTVSSGPEELDSGQLITRFIRKQHPRQNT